MILAYCHQQACIRLMTLGACHYIVSISDLGDQFFSDSAQYLCAPLVCTRRSTASGPASLSES